MQVEAAVVVKVLQYKNIKYFYKKGVENFNAFFMFHSFNEIIF